MWSSKSIAEGIRLAKDVQPASTGAIVQLEPVDDDDLEPARQLLAEKGIHRPVIYLKLGDGCMLP